MTPAEAAAERSEQLQRCTGNAEVAVVHARIVECGEDMARTGRELHTGKPLTSLDLALEPLTGFAETLADYRATRTLCAGLYQLLSLLGLAETIRGLAGFRPLVLVAG